MADDKRINIEVDQKLWRKVGALAAEMGITKKDFVGAALQNWVLEIDKTPSD